MNTQSLKSIIPLAIAVIALVGYNYIGAQSNPPTGTPPANNVAAPINVSATYQIKAGDLGVVRARSGYYCDATGASCLQIPVGGNGPATANVIRTKRLSNGVGNESLLAARVRWNSEINKTSSFSSMMAGICTWDAGETHPTSGNVTTQKSQNELFDECANIMCQSHEELDFGFALKHSSGYHNGSGVGSQNPGIFKIDCLY